MSLSSSAAAALESGSIFSFLESKGIEAADVDDLYSSPWAALAVFQSLPALAQNLVLRLLPLRGWVSRRFLAAWLRPSGEAASRAREALAAALERLTALSILGGPDADGGGGGGGGAPLLRALDVGGVAEECAAADVLALHAGFRGALSAALTGAEAVPWEAASAALPPLRGAPALAEIEAYAASRWNAILHFLVGSPDAPTPEAKMVRARAGGKERATAGAVARALPPPPHIFSPRASLAD